MTQPASDPNAPFRHSIVTLKDAWKRREWAAAGRSNERVRDAYTQYAPPHAPTPANNAALRNTGMLDATTP